jgi:DNA repair protein RadD
VTTYRDLVSRADSAWLQQHIGVDAVRVLQALNSSNERSSAIRDVFLSLLDPYQVLASASQRASLFELLRPAEASALANALNLAGDPYEALSSVRLNRRTDRFRLCCAFLGLPDEDRQEHVVSPPVEAVEARYALFPHQQRAVQSTIDALGSGRRRVVLHMPTGAGKTRMAMHVVCRHLIHHSSTVVVWLANSEELCDQASDEFMRAWSQLGNRSVELYRFWGARRLDMAQVKDGLLIGGFPKLYALARSSVPEVARLGDKTSLLVVDEAHQAIAPTYELITQGLSARKLDMPVLGLTATPGRTWNDPEADRKLADFFAHNKTTLQVAGYKDPIEFLVNQGFLASATFRQLRHQSANLAPAELVQLAEDLDVPAAVLKKLAADERRSVRIVREVEDLLTRHHRVIIFATTVGHAKLLSAVLSSRGNETRCVTGDTTEAHRSESVEWFKGRSTTPRAIVNFGVLTTGFDAPQTSAAVIARPTKSLVLYSQMVGRAIRGVKAGGNATAEIVTVVDTALPGFGDLASAFNNWEDVW